MATNAETVVVVTDANVLINLIRISQLPLLGQLDGYRFLVPTEVVNEITEPDQREALSGALAGGFLEQVVVDTMELLQLFADLRDVMGMGEACLVLAATRGCHIVSDVKKRFRRRAVELIGEERIVRTEELLLEAIRQGRISVVEADGFKTVLAANRYSMPFQSFADLM